MPSPRLPSGLLTASLTPFDADDRIHPDAFIRHVEWLRAQGSDGILLFGTTGEGLSLSVEERIEGLDTILSAHVSEERLLVGTGAAALPDAVRLTQHATAGGVGGVLVMPPHHYQSVKEEGVFRFFDQLIQGVGDSDLRLYFYHFPELSGVPIPFSVIQRLLDAYPDQIAGIKDSDGEWDHTQALCSDFPDLQVFAGTERLLLRVLRAGGAGSISATANVTGSLAARVVAEWRAGNDPDPLQEQLTGLRTAFAPLPTIPALKHILAHLLEAPEWATVRPPLAPLTDDEAAEVDALLGRLREEVELPG